MKTMQISYPVKILGRAFDVSCSGFYAWLNKKPSSRAQKNKRLKLAIKAVHNIRE